MAHNVEENKSLWYFVDLIAIVWKRWNEETG